MTECDVCKKIRSLWREIEFMETDAHVAHMEGRVQEEGDLLRMAWEVEERIRGMECHWCSDFDPAQLVGEPDFDDIPF